jgi:hypothetical protein
MKTLNTQLASWTQLRHDTILYAKQSYTAGGLCVYPAGYVEPRIEFWRRLKQMASRAAEQVAALKYEGTYAFLSSNTPPESGSNVVSLAAIQDRQVSHLQSFAATVGRLETLAKKELAQEPFTTEDEEFIDALMEGSVYHRCAGYWEYNGWYPQLFYRAIYWTDNGTFHPNYGAGAFDALVADVHTDVPCGDCGGDPGSVLHEAVGRVNLLMIAVDNGPDRFVCAGPVLSHYEFEVIGDPRRLNDEEWRGVIANNFPSDVPASRFEGLAPPVWTRGYLVPAQ